MVISLRRVFGPVSSSNVAPVHLVCSTTSSTSSSSTSKSFLISKSVNAILNNKYNCARYILTVLYYSWF